MHYHKMIHTYQFMDLEFFSLKTILVQQFFNIIAKICKIRHFYVNQNIFGIFLFEEIGKH